MTVQWVRITHSIPVRCHNFPSHYRSNVEYITHIYMYIKGYKWLITITTAYIVLLGILYIVVFYFSRGTFLYYYFLFSWNRISVSDTPAVFGFTLLINYLVNKTRVTRTRIIYCYYDHYYCIQFYNCTRYITPYVLFS